MSLIGEYAQPPDDDYRQLQLSIFLAVQSSSTLHAPHDEFHQYSTSTEDETLPYTFTHAGELWNQQ